MGLRRQLAGIVPDEVIPQVSNHFDVIGDIAVLALPETLAPYKTVIAQAIVSHRKNIFSVLNKTRKITGSSRTAGYDILVGKSTITHYREFGFTYRLDLKKTFFTPRMAHERRRVTEQVEPGERVLIPFAGAGPFVIPAAARGGRVTAVEMNPDAFSLLVENIRLNRVGGNCQPVLADATDTSRFSPGSFDRLIVPAPYGMDHAPALFLPLLSRGAMAHLYLFKAKEQIPGLLQAFEQAGFSITYYSPCGNVAPGISRWVFDIALPLGY